MEADRVGGPRIQVVQDADELGRAGADLVAGVFAATPAASVVVATGRTPMGLYAELAGCRRSGLADTTRITVYQLDEYLGLEPGDRRSLFGWMRRRFLEPLGITGERVVRLPLGGDLEGACAAFDRALEERGGLDLAILGLGPNGHLGFNEPPSDPWAPTRVVDLSPVTIVANASYWGEVADVPTRAVTMGMGQLLSARAIVLVVSGKSKREIAHRALEGPVGPGVPASFLQEAASGVTVIVDRAAWGNG
ncbi:MAG: glucosamine-6-phosphate deaminase [Actinobacteria bacterium]|nr:glucosamine-6-phosphate deaminase [Actinomycetota bacterium]